MLKEWLTERRSESDLMEENEQRTAPFIANDLQNNPVMAIIVILAAHWERPSDVIIWETE